MHPDDWEHLGLKWEGQYYFEKALPFGLRSAPFLFNQLSDTIEWILKEKCAISYVLIMEPHASHDRDLAGCQGSLTSMQKAFQALGIPISPGKTEGPTTVIEFLGIVLDS